MWEGSRQLPDKWKFKSDRQKPSFQCRNKWKVVRESRMMYVSRGVTSDR